MGGLKVSSNLAASAGMFKRRVERPVRRLSGSFILVVIAVALLYPLLDALVGSFFQSGTGRPTLSYWSQLWSTLPIARDMGVSAGLSIAVVLLVLVLAVPCGYALSKLRFRGAGASIVPTIPILTKLMYSGIRIDSIGIIMHPTSPIVTAPAPLKRSLESA